MEDLKKKMKEDKKERKSFKKAVRECELYGAGSLNFIIRYDGYLEYMRRKWANDE